jgi:PII-like signaling protein
VQAGDPFHSSNVQIPTDAILLRIFIGEDDKAGHMPLYEAIVLKARELHLAGATVLRGPVGFGRSKRLHTTKVLRLADKLPLVIEIVDDENAINKLLVALEPLMTEKGLLTIEKVKVLRYGNLWGTT